MSVGDCWHQLQMELDAAGVGRQIKQAGWFMGGITQNLEGTTHLGRLLSGGAVAGVKLQHRKLQHEHQT